MGRPGVVARPRETKGSICLGNPVAAELFGGMAVTSCHILNDALRIVTSGTRELFGGFKQRKDAQVKDNVSVYIAPTPHTIPISMVCLVVK